MSGEKRATFRAIDAYKPYMMGTPMPAGASWSSCRTGQATFYTMNIDILHAVLNASVRRSEQAGEEAALAGGEEAVRPQATLAGGEEAVREYLHDRRRMHLESDGKFSECEDVLH